MIGECCEGVGKFGEAGLTLTFGVGCLLARLPDVFERARHLLDTQLPLVDERYDQLEGLHSELQEFTGSAFRRASKDLSENALPKSKPHVDEAQPLLFGLLPKKVWLFSDG